MAEPAKRALALAMGALLLASTMGLALHSPRVADAQRGDELDALLARFAAIPGLSCSFREEKSIALLAVPLVNEGELHFAPPGRLARHTRSPSPSSLVLVDRQLTMGSGANVRTMAVAENPALRVFVDSFVNLLSGDKAALDADFTMDFRPEGEGWKLSLRPRLPTLRRVIDAMEVEGRGVILESLVIREANGDVSRTTFSDVNAARRFDAGELSRIFRVRGS